MLKYSLFVLLSGLSTLIMAQNSQPQDEGKIKYYCQNYFIIEGTSFTDSVKENLYDRFPALYIGKVRAPVWSLSKGSAGISVRCLKRLRY